MYVCMCVCMYVCMCVSFFSISFSKLVTEYRRLAKEGRGLTKKLSVIEEELKNRVLGRYRHLRSNLPPGLTSLPSSSPPSTPHRHATSGHRVKDDKVLSLAVEMADKQRSTRMGKVSECGGLKLEKVGPL